MDIDRLGELVRNVLTDPQAPSVSLKTRPEYSLQRIVLDSKGSYELECKPSETATIFVEEGAMQAGSFTVAPHELLNISRSSGLELIGKPAATAYIFRGTASDCLVAGKPTPTSDFRSKYWGSIETIVNAEYTGKRLFFRKGQHSSLHFHCAKTETYFIHSGRLLLRLRAGRGEDRWFVLPAGTTLDIPPGLMHQSGAIEDTVIIEISTHDEDSDSFLVEDGQRIPMPRLRQIVEGNSANQRKIVFDLDGCLCSQTDGDYEKATPIREAIDLVNRLYERGHQIVIHTSRFMGRSHGVVALAYNDGFTLTQQQLSAWGVRYHLLVMGKPAADIVVDDRGVFFLPDWDRIAEEIETELNPLDQLTITPNRTGNAQ
jgi:quercetin dioxygenase-like cupin family protein